MYFLKMHLIEIIQAGFWWMFHLPLGWWSKTTFLAIFDCSLFLCDVLKCLLIYSNCSYSTLLHLLAQIVQHFWQHLCRVCPENSFLFFNFDVNSMSIKTLRTNYIRITQLKSHWMLLFIIFSVCLSERCWSATASLLYSVKILIYIL